MADLVCSKFALFRLFTLWLLHTGGKHLVHRIDFHCWLLISVFALSLLHGALSNYFSSQTRDNSITLLKTFRKAALHLPAS